MKAGKSFILSLLALSVFASAQAAFAAGEVLVIMKSDTASAATAAARASAHESASLKASAAAKTAGAAVSRTFSMIAGETGKTIVLMSSKTKTADELISELSSNPDVASVVRNNAHKIMSVENTPNDELWGEQWGPKRIGAPKVWSKNTGSKDVYVAVLDTGVIYDHPDLAANMCEKLPDGTYGMMFHHAIDASLDIIPGSALATAITRGGTPTADTTSADLLSLDYATVGDIYGHGTHVAGIIGAVGNNSIGTAGVNWNVRIIPVGVFTQGRHTLPVNIEPESFGAMNYDSDVIAGLDYVVELKRTYGVNVAAINISVGDWVKKDGYNFDQDTNPVAWSIKAASDAGIIVCIAAGNEYQDLDSPGTAPKGVDYSDYFEYPATFRFANTISVGASASDDTKASFSNYSSSGAWVDVFAPGLQIMSTVPTVSIVGSGTYDRSGYCYLGGTSMAAPMTAGTVALLAACYPEKSASEIKAMIVNGAERGVLGAGYSKYGLINVWNAYSLGQESSGSGGSGGCSAGFWGLAALVLAGGSLLRYKRR